MTGKLPIGVEFAGKLHQDFELRREKAADLVALYDDPARAERAEKNKAYAGVCLLSSRLVKLGEIPKEAITPELVMELDSEDFQALQAYDAGRALPPRPEGA